MNSKSNYKYLLIFLVGLPLATILALGIRKYFGNGVFIAVSLFLAFSLQYVIKSKEKNETKKPMPYYGVSKSLFIALFAISGIVGFALARFIGFL